VVVLWLSCGYLEVVLRLSCGCLVVVLSCRLQKDTFFFCCHSHALDRSGRGVKRRERSSSLPVVLSFGSIFLLSCVVLCCLVLSCVALPCLVLSCLVLSCLGVVFFCLVVGVLPCLVLSGLLP
jgi:hypothetical protein